MKSKQKIALALVLTAFLAIYLMASAMALKIANQGDALSIDLHSLNESLQLTVVGNVYDPLVTPNSGLLRF